MSWQEELNKKLEEQRANYQKSITSGVAHKRIKSWLGSRTAATKSPEDMQKWTDAGSAKIQEMIKSGEWSKISSRGWEGIKDKEAARENMRKAAKLANTPEVRVKHNATKAKNRIAKELEFFNQLNDIFTNKEWSLVAKSMGMSRKWGQRIVSKRATKVSWDGRIQTYKKKQ
tara:strand:+ start:87 stop:602 length:516 start_codon:yes stop_codon:yes gene_type:complete